MIRFFKSSFFVQYLTIGIVAFILWGRAFIVPPAMPAPQGFVPLYNFLFTWLSSIPLLAVILGWILLMIASYILNDLFTGNELVQKNSTLACFIFVILMSYYHELLILQPIIICCLLLLMILRQLFISYNTTEPYDLVFSAGFLCTIGSFFYFPFVFFYGLIIFSFIFYRAASWREWISSILGFLSPFFFLGVYYFWYDELFEKYLEYISFIGLQLDIKLLLKPVFTIFTGIIFIFFLISKTNGFKRSIEKTIEIRRKTFLVNLMLFFALMSIPFSSHLVQFHIELLFIPFAAIIASYCLQLRDHFWQELFLISFFILIVLNNLVFKFY